MTMMLHSPQVHGFFGVPTDPLSSRPVFKYHFEQHDLSGTIVVAPDMGHAKSAARFAKDLGLPIAAGNKERLSDTEVRISGIVGQQIHGFRRAMIYDDEVATGSSILEMSRLLIQQEIQEIWVACAHGVYVELDRIFSVSPRTDRMPTANEFHIRYR